MNPRQEMADRLEALGFVAEAARVVQFPRKASFVTIYALIDENGQRRYVGQTRCRLKKRLKWHYRAARKPKSRVERWLSQQKAQRRKVQIVALQVSAVWDTDEIAWIARSRAEGCILLNMTDGGNTPKRSKHRHSGKRTYGETP